MTLDTVPLKSQISFGSFEAVDLRVARCVSAPIASGTRAPCRVLTLSLGHLGPRTSVGQLALVDERDLVGRNLVVCVNFAPRQMGRYTSEVLVLGAPHPDGPPDQAQATPLYVSDAARPGDCVF